MPNGRRDGSPKSSLCATPARSSTWAAWGRRTRPARKAARFGDFGAQCRYAWDKIKRLLEKHGATLENVDKVTTYVTDIRYFFEAGKCRGEIYGGITPPAGTFLVVTALAWPGMLIEVDVIASTAK
jgi:enamine deaminase RidA (YjgF/YER057c/UK114 family)